MRRIVLLIVFALCVSGCRDTAPTPRIVRVQPAAPASVLPQPSAPAAATPPALVLPASWRAAYAPPTAGMVVYEAADAVEAAAAVRHGAAVHALTTAAAAHDLSAHEFDAVAVVFVVRLTFPLEELSAAQARDLLRGRVRDWSEVGGPPGPVRVLRAPGAPEAETLRGLFGDVPTLAPAPADTTPAAGVVLIDTAGRRLTGAKTLRIAAAEPDSPDYPFVERRVVAARAADSARAAALAGELGRVVRETRPVTVTLDAVGDIMLGRGVWRLSAERGTDYPFAAVRSLLAQSDIRFGNLELPLTERGMPAPKDYVFRAPPRAVGGLTAAGFTVLSLANNHALDYGAEGLIDTLDTLDGAGIARVGAGRDPREAHTPALLTVRGVRIAFLAYANTPNDGISGWVAQSSAVAPGHPGVAWGTPDAVRRDVAAARAHADVVVVAIHAGNEYAAAPNAVQVALAHAAVDAGAALVLGAHPHVLQGIEYYRDVPIFYSLGNFVFDLDDDDRRQPGLPSVLSLIARVTLTAEGVRSVRLLPVTISATEGRPEPANGAAARAALERVYRLTEALSVPSNGSSR